MRLIEITVAPDGRTRVETKGFRGNECQAASRLIEQALGRRAAEQLTSDFFAVNAANESQSRESQ